jgi:hypothetical protein
MVKEGVGYLSRAGLGRKQTVWMDQHNSDAFIALASANGDAGAALRFSHQHTRRYSDQSKAVTILFDSIYMY